jgi:hypothetical protein
VKPFSFLTLAVAVLALSEASWASAGDAGGFASHGSGQARFGVWGTVPPLEQVPRDSSAAVIGHGYLPSRPFVPYYGFYGPSLGWGFESGPFWYGPGWAYPYEVPPDAQTGGLRLEITPKTAEVYVDGFYAGVVDDFKGHFHHLDMIPGEHHIVVRAPLFRPLAFDTYVEPDHTTDYKGGLIRAQKTGQ